MDINKPLNSDTFPPTVDKLNFVDHISKFSTITNNQILDKILTS